MENANPTVPAEETMPAKPAALASGDKHIWGIYIALCLISIIELYSASSREVASSSLGVIGPVVRHIVMLLGGFGIVWFISRRHYSDVIPFTIIFALVSVCMMLYVMFFGDVVNGARRSLTILGIGIYPAEMVKLSAVLLIALVMTWNQNPKELGITTTGVQIASIVMLILSGLLVKQGLTNTILLVAISFSMMTVGGVKFKHLAIVAGTLALCGVIFMGFVKDDDGENRWETWKARVERFADKSAPKYEMPIDATNRQEMYSYMAQANGGVYGKGPGNSREASRLPLAFSDYIYAIVIEETGLLGGVLVLVLYLWLLGRAAGIASRCNRTYPALLVMGMAIMIAFQALFHMGIVTGVFPVSGQPLPLISKGGTSIAVTALAFGIMLSVSRTSTRQGNKNREIKDEMEALPENFGGQNPMQL
ncbi:MAG: FtsW/RodA/SpoVE family cell cycle protein [Lachnoclostridium sp.]|nr:FtsW/RodA/SpoVE family cell cycle protein [Lachnoclostridium sp.]